MVRRSRLIRSVKISFDRDVPVFGKRDFALFKKMAEAIYGAKVIHAEDAKEVR